MKYLNIFIFLSLSTLYLLFSSQIKFSTNFIEIFFSQESIKLFSVAKKLGLNDEILISKKGFDAKSLDELYIIADEIQKIEEIKRVDITLLPSRVLKEYLKANYLLLADFNNSKLSQKDVESGLKHIYDNLYEEAMYSPINSYDPLELFALDAMGNERYLRVKDYGYAIKAQVAIDTSNATDAKVLYEKVGRVLDAHEDTISFAPFYYLVENSSYIRGDAQSIMLISTIFLLLLYFFILKNHKLFFNTIITIGSSILSAILLSWFFFDTISILALVFGISITTVSVDYMFHYYFHNDFSQKKFIVQKRVLFGFLTTFGVFFIISFIDIELFSQLAFFSASSLAVAYLLFSWIFVYLDIKNPQSNIKAIDAKRVKPIYIVIVSVFMLVYSYENLSFDTNLKNLDYQNTKLLNLSEKFKKGLGSDRYKSIIVSAKDKESLLLKYEELLTYHKDMLGIGKFVFSNKKCQEKLKNLREYDFASLKKLIDSSAKEIGFNDVFKNAYSGVDSLKCNMHPIDDMKFKIIKEDETYYTLALVDKSTKVKKMDGVEVISLVKTLHKDTQIMRDKLIKYMLISMIFIVVMLFLISGFDLLYPLAYLLFPISVVLMFISFFGKINIMHMFALVILIAIGIDYGIYMHKSTTIVQTKKAIRYALLSTFSGFGVLIFSSTTALYSIGFVISVGIGAIFLLLLYTT
jgi:hypothetical protein